MDTHTHTAKDTAGTITDTGTAGSQLLSKIFWKDLCVVAKIKVIQNFFRMTVGNDMGNGACDSIQTFLARNQLYEL